MQAVFFLVMRMREKFTYFFINYLLFTGFSVIITSQHSKAYENVIK